MAKKTQKKTVEKPSYPAIADTRLKQIHFTMEDLKVDALVITYLPNIRYLTNFSGTNATLFITEKDIIFITDDRYEEQIKEELYPLPNMKTFVTRDPWELIKKKKFLKDIGSLAFEADRMTYTDAVYIRNLIRPIKFKPCPNVVERFTQPKAPEELEYIQKSCDMSIQVYEKVIQDIKPGMTERELAIEICHQSRLLGSESEPFDIIAVSGPRGALVHGKPSDRKIKKGDIILMDFGCTVNGYASDITRAVAVGKATKEQKNIYEILHKAKEQAIAEVRPGMNGKTLDKIARDIIKKEGYADYFKHSLGHGVGIEVHEAPVITFRESKEEQIVPENVVLAIEPGIYLPDKFGLRIEDCIQVTRNGGKHITKAPEKLVVL